MSKNAIRQLVFETNSSSVHALALLDEDAYEEWADQGAYVDLRRATEDDYLGHYNALDALSATDFTDVSADMIGHTEIGQIRKELPQENYHEHPDDCLLEAGILPYDAISQTGDPGTPSAYWRERCGGLTYIECEYDPEIGKYKLAAEWFAW